jgi:small subunit ribosomal protein S18
MLRRYLTDHSKIKPRRKAGTCARHQRILSIAIKRARHVALLPFVSEATRGE